MVLNKSVARSYVFFFVSLYMRFWALVLSVYFLLLSLAPNWQGLEFFKTEALLKHYQAYQKEAQDPSFLAFVLIDDYFHVLELIIGRFNIDVIRRNLDSVIIKNNLSLIDCD